MRNTPLVTKEYYHVLNRGNNKQKIFLEKKDWIRFLFMILYFQADYRFSNIRRIVHNFQISSDFKVKNINKLINNRYVNLIAFSLMPNHFHLLVQQKIERGISQYMQRILNSYTKYFNFKYDKSGHLFQGPFKAVHVKTNQQLLYLSAYIHRNAREIAQWKDKEEQYPWSSFQDYIIKNRWPELLITNDILSQFSSKKEYKEFTEDSGAKTDNQDIQDLINYINKMSI